MTTPRIYTQQPLSEQQTILLDQEQSHQLQQVLRLKPGSAVILFDNSGTQFPSQLIDYDKKRAQIKVGMCEHTQCDAKLPMHLGQVISRGERMDYTIQKSVELGVTSITPLFSQRCGVKLPPERLAKRLQHWHKVMIHACQQCGRNRLAGINSPLVLGEWLAKTQGLKLFCSPTAITSLDRLSPHEKINSETGISLLIGSEGGFDTQEESAIQQAGFNGLSLGPRTLRTETAAVVALSLIQYCWGDLKK